MEAVIKSPPFYFIHKNAYGLFLRDILNLKRSIECGC